MRCFVRSAKRQMDHECGAGPARPGHDCPAMSFDDGLADFQADTHAVGFGGDKRLEQPGGSPGLSDNINLTLLWLCPTIPSDTASRITSFMSSGHFRLSRFSTKSRR